jgi:hypothetical protein
MIKRRFGEQFHAEVAERLEIKQVESRKAAGDKKRRPVKGGKRQLREGKPQQTQEGQEAKKTEEKPQSQEGKKEAPKREARRRGPREGQQ